MGTLVRFLDHRERPHDPLGCWLDQWPSLGQWTEVVERPNITPNPESVGRRHLPRERQRRQLLTTRPTKGATSNLMPPPRVSSSVWLGSPLRMR
jgi:hypothetical protein